MMRKVSLFLCFAVLVLVLAGCSDDGDSSGGSERPVIKRTVNSQNDEIRFYGLDWLTEKKDIEKKFNAEYGKETYVSEKRVVVGGVSYEQSYFPNVTDYPHPSGITRTNYVYYGVGAKKNEYDLADLNWSFGGNTLSEIDLYFLSNDNGKSNYLYGASLTFDNVTRKAYNEVAGKMGILYKQTDQQSSTLWESYTYTDSNNNSVEIVYYKSDYQPQTMRFDYFCGDMSELAHKLREDEDAVKEQRRKEIVRKENPDL